MCILFWDERASAASPCFTIHGVVETFQAQREARAIRCSYTVFLASRSRGDEILHVVHDSPCGLSLERLDADQGFRVAVLKEIYDLDCTGGIVRARFPGLIEDGPAALGPSFVPLQPPGALGSQLEMDHAAEGGPFCSYALGRIPAGSQSVVHISVDVTGPFYEASAERGRFRICSADGLAKGVEARVTFSADQAPWQDLLATRIKPNRLEPRFYDLIFLHQDPLRITSSSSGIVRDPTIPEILWGKCERWYATAPGFELEVSYAADSRREEGSCLVGTVLPRCPC